MHLRLHIRQPSLARTRNIKNTYAKTIHANQIRKAQFEKRTRTYYVKCKPPKKHRGEMFTKESQLQQHIIGARPYILAKNIQFSQARKHYNKIYDSTHIIANM